MNTDILRLSLRARTRGLVPPANLTLSTVRPQCPLARVVAYVWAQCLGPCALCAWVATRELYYFEGPGRTWTWEQIVYAACRDAACWQLGKSENQMLESI